MIDEQEEANKDYGERAREREREGETGRAGRTAREGLVCVCVCMLTRGEDENAIDLSSIVLPDHVLRALISIDLLSLFTGLPSPLYSSSFRDYHHVDNHKWKRRERNGEAGNGRREGSRGDKKGRGS